MKTPFTILALSMLASAIPALGQGHPFLFMTPADVARVQHNATSSVFFAELAQSQISVAQQVDVNQLPPFETDWWAEEEPKPYGERDRSVTLEHLRLVPLEYGMAAKDCARAWILTGDTNHLDKAKAVLLQHAEYDFGFDDVNCGIDYTVASFGAMEAYDIVYDHFSQQEHDTLDDFFMRLVAAVEQNNDYWIATNPSGTEMNNHEGRHRACMAMVGFFYDIQRYIDKAITDPKGFYDMLQDGFQDEGLWPEASLPYQFVQLDAMLWIAELAHNAGYPVNLYTHTVAGRSLQGCYDTVFSLTFPDGLLPPIGDGYGGEAYPGQLKDYELLHTRLGDDKYAWLIDRSDNRDRDSLFWGIANLPQGNPPSSPSKLWPEHGYAALRTNEGTNYWAGNGWTLFTDFSSNRTHEHADKLSIMLYGKGHLWLRDSECRADQVERSAADVTVLLNNATVSHNTVMIDLVDQKKELPAPLELLEFSTTPGHRRITMGDSGDLLYPGVRQLRTCIVRDDYVVDVFQVKAREAHDIAWTTHIDGELHDVFASEFGPANLPTNGPWQYIQTDDISAPTNAFWETFSHGGTFFRMDVASSQPSQYTRSRYLTVEAAPQEYIPMRMVGCHAAEATFVAVYRTGDAAITSPVEIEIGDASEGSWMLDIIVQGVTNGFTIRDLAPPPPSALPSLPYVDDALTHLLLHCDQLGSIGPVQTPDDDSATPGRNHDGTMFPASYPPSAYTGATLGNSFDAAFGTAFHFNGINQLIRAGDSTTDDLGVPGNHVRVEVYARLDRAKSNDDSLYSLFYQASRFAVAITDRAVGDWLLGFTVWTDLGTKQVAMVIDDPEVWHHYALEFSDGRLEAFVDGNSVGWIDDAGSALQSAIRHLYIGGTHFNARWWEGSIDEFRIGTLAEEPPYSAWMGQYPGVGIQTNMLVDPDGDGLNNLHEWAFGGNPAYTGDIGYVPTFGTVESMGGDTRFEYVYPKRNDADALGLGYHLEQNDNLTNNAAWTNANYYFEEGDPDSAGSGFFAVTNWVDTLSKDAQFLRLIIEAD